jgi:Kef-type K+ transport system membrane component KefB
VVALFTELISGLFINETLPRRIAMVPRGEIGLIFAELGRSAGVLNTEVYAGLILVIALTTLLPPFVLKVFYKRFKEE